MTRRRNPPVNPYFRNNLQYQGYNNMINTPLSPSRVAEKTMKKSCLVLLAHGSPDPRWRAPFEKLANQLRSGFGGDRVLLAYMEFVAPSLLDAAEVAVRGGGARLSILPLFMAGGGHVDRDIPVQAEVVRRRFPGLEVRILPPAGEHPKVAAALREIASDELRNG
jgi:sirohydrochlorin cobaltochelatase